MSKATEKKAPKDGGVLAAVRAKYGEESCSFLGQIQFPKVLATSTGSLLLDKALGCGGYPRGRIIEAFGAESSGKTTLALHGIAEVQRLGETAAFIDAEHALDPEYAAALGVKRDELLFSQPQSGEQALDLVIALAESGDVSFIVVDSVAALTPLAEMEGDMSQQHVGLQARLMGKALRKLCSVANAKRCTVFFLNQTRMKIGVMYGSPETTPGGNALKFYASVRLQCGRREQIKEGEDPVGNHVNVKVIKNKVGVPFKSADLSIRWGVGIDRAADLLHAGVEAGTIVKAGSWFKLADGTALAQGGNTAAAKLLEDKDLRVRVWRETRKALGLEES